MRGFLKIYQGITKGFDMYSATKKIQLSTAAVAVAAAAAITPVISHAAPPSVPSAAPVLTWGYDQLDTALIAQDNDGPRAAASADATAAPTPQQLVQYLVQGIATGVAGIVRGTVVIAGTVTYVAIVFTGGVITAVGDVLPGPVGDFLVNVGTSVNNVADDVARALRVGPYATSTV